VGSVKAHLLREVEDSSVVVRRVVEYKVANCTRSNTELLERGTNDSIHILAAMGTC
jgi:hypothetical protein